jgi:hypothetical protein
LTDRPPAAQSWAGRRVRLVGGAVAVGLLLGTLGFALGLALQSTPRRTSTLVFVLGALALGFGTLGWSGSILAGEGFQRMQRLMDTSSGWTERKSRRAMARVGGFGAGVMLAAMAIGTMLGV